MRSRSSTSTLHRAIGTSAGRPTDDFYVTPVFAIEQLLARETFTGVTWEPACGNGAISKYLLGKVLSSDLYDHGYGEVGIDFLRTHRAVDNVVTNPPYRLAQEFVEHALSVATCKVAFLLRLAFLESKRRYPLFRTTPLRTVYVFSGRISVARNNVLREKGRARMLIAYAWYVWEHGYKGQPRLDWILK